MTSNRLGPLTVAATLAFTFALAQAEEPATRPAIGALADQPPAPLDPAVERILDSLERKGQTISDIQAKLEYVKMDTVLDSKEVFTGILLFKDADPNPRFHIRFDRSVNAGIVNTKKEWHIFDGQDYIEARESTRTINRTPMVKPGEQVQVFRLGHGPFPLPFGQSKDDILRHFSVRLIAPAEGDPKNTDHLECTPLPGIEMAKRYGAIHFYIDRNLNLPVKMSTVDKNLGEEISAAFSDLEFKPIAASALNLPRLQGFAENTNGP